jgi:hypothetical protein
VETRLAIAALAVCACANAGPIVPDGPQDASGESSPPSGECPAGQFATSVDSSLQVTCAPIDGPVQRGLDTRCSVYAGWRDGCDNCTTDPAKWGFVSGGSCTAAVGADDTCSMATLGNDLVPLFGLNPDGDVDGNDKIYTTLHCTVAEKTVGIAPCPADQFITGTLGSSFTCTSMADAVAGFIRASCSVYFGWQDSCDGCTNPPVKWGLAGDHGCTNGAGADDTCTTATLGGETVQLFGLNPDGNVDGNDKLHVGLRCTVPEPVTGMAANCPDGEFATAALPGGMVRCESAAPLIAQYFNGHCAIYLGWRDSCDGCTTPPLKWGVVHSAVCANGAGADNTCGTFMLGDDSVTMFGLNPDGDVDGNDKLYVGFRCR